VVIQKSKKGQRKKIFEIKFDKLLKGYKIMDSGDLKLFVKMEEQVVKNFNSEFI